jgi:hypothetical protein
LPGFERTPCFCRREIAERHTGTAKIVLLGQSTDDAPVHLTPDHSDGGALQACDIGDRGSRGCNKQYYGMGEDHDGLRLRQVANVAAYDGEVRFAR